MDIKKMEKKFKIWCGIDEQKMPNWKMIYKDRWNGYIKQVEKKEKQEKLTNELIKKYEVENTEENKKIYWLKDTGAMTAPKGYSWYSNGGTRFPHITGGKRRKQALIKD